MGEKTYKLEPKIIHSWVIELNYILTAFLTLLDEERSKHSKKQNMILKQKINDGNNP